jgi:hypothetical protein
VAVRTVVDDMVKVYRRPTNVVQLSTQPQLASWDKAGHDSQVRLEGFLAHVAIAAAPVIATTGQPLAVELTVGLSDTAPLTGGGRDLDNYLFPIAQRLGPARVAAMFGRKTHGASRLAVGGAEQETAPTFVQFSTRIAGSYVRPEWKRTLRERLIQANVAQVESSAVTMGIAITTGARRNWANLWKPLIDSFGPVLGEDPHRPFNPHDDRIVSLGLHHHVDVDLGHDVIIEAWWASGWPMGTRRQRPSLPVHTRPPRTPDVVRTTTAASALSW